MADPQFDLFLTGHLAVGSDRDRAVKQLSTLFKRPAEHVDKLLRGRSSRIRKAISSAELERLQRGFDKLGILTESRPSATGSEQRQAVAEHASAASEPLTLCPSGSPVLREQERQAFQRANIDTSALSLAATGSRLQEHQVRSVEAPATDHLSIVELDDLALGNKAPPPTLDLDELCGALSIAEVGSLLGASSPKPAPAPPSTDHLKLG